MIPRATYRLQLHKGFTFQDAAKQAGYLAALGISHVYTSPIFTARAGSVHGYDVIDHSQLNPELGGEEGFRLFSEALKAHGLGLIVDIVPNHMAVGKADNRWWLDLLQNGAASKYAGTFDIDWDAPGLEGKVLVPFLDGKVGDVVGKGDLKLRRENGQWAFGYFDHRFPLRPQDQQADWSDATDDQMMALLDRQNFVLSDWREADARINWRRFFDINDLAAIRIGEPEVFEAVHGKLFALYGEGLIDGVRVDHVDGLADPRAYCRLLRERLEQLRPGAYIVVEKILADGEDLPRSWPVDGTTGYDFMNEASAVLHDEDDGALEALWHAQSRRQLSFEEEETSARREILDTKFQGQFEAVVRAFAKVVPDDALRPALRSLVLNMRRYRSYATGLADSPGPGPGLSSAIERAGQERPHLAPVLAKLDEMFRATDGDRNIVDALRRFHQLCAPVAAKAVEDTAFYRYGRLLSRNDVGFDPRRHTLPNVEFHRRMAQRQAQTPHAMLATATHDHKRGEDTRARLAALTTHHQAWAAFARRHPAPSTIDPADHYQLLQTLVGAWPEEMSENFGERITRWCEKYLREAKLRSSWSAPDTAYEEQVKSVALDLIASPEAEEFRNDLGTFLDQIRPTAEANTLIQAVLHLTLPGVPDIYQGCEFPDLSLVDPDNRRSVDYAARSRALKQGQVIKQRVIALILAERNKAPKLWREGDYAAIPTPGASDVIAFCRQHGDAWLGVFAGRHPDSRPTVSLPWPSTDILSGREFPAGDTAIGSILSDLPVTVLRSTAAG